MTVNAIEIEILRNALVAAAEEMSVTVWRTSRSSVVREILDYSTCVFDADGYSVAQAARMPVHLNSMASCLRDIVEHHISIDEFGPGDIIVTNDPYSGGQHLSDVQTFMPVFDGDTRIAVVGILVHHLDVGGGAPGSFDPLATEIYQEGFRIPPVHLARDGERNQALIDTFLRNSREPEQVGGDFESQLAALEIGRQRVVSVSRRYGPALLAQACNAIQAQSEQSMRRAIDRIPDGVYQFQDFVDDDGLSEEALTIDVVLKVSADQLVVDLSDSSVQAAGPVNCTYNMTSSAVFCGIMMAIGADIPANAGCYRPISIETRPGTCTAAISPAPVANRMAVGHRVVNATMGAMAQALPGQVAAAYYGVSYAYAISIAQVSHEIRPDNQTDDDLPSTATADQRRVYFDLECGGWGASASGDGASAFSCGFHNIANTPIETIEADYAVTFTEYGLAADTGGGGQFRGGLGLRRSFRLDAEQGNFTANLDRFRFPPYGLEGGEAGAVGQLWCQRADGERVDLPSKITRFMLKRGDTINLQTAGGGGFGPRNLRTKASIDADRLDGYITTDNDN